MRSKYKDAKHYMKNEWGYVETLIECVHNYMNHCKYIEVFMWLKFVRYGYTETLVRMFCMSVYVVCHFIEMTG